MKDALARIVSDWLMEYMTSNRDNADEQGHWIAEAILAAGYRKAEASTKAEVWDECLDAIEEHELNTEQARAGNPYRVETEGAKK